MTAWPDILRRISLRPTFPMTLEARAPQRIGDGWRIRAILPAPDIHTGEMHTVHMEWPAPANLDDENAFKFVRMLLRELLYHELDECLLLDGVQINDPHGRP